MFRYGAVVLFDVSASEQTAYLEQIRPLVIQPFPDLETEEVDIRIEPEGREGMDGNTVVLQEGSIERLQILADVLSKSIVLAKYESKVARDFDRIEPLAVNLERNARSGRNTRELLSHIGGALLSEHKMVGRVQMDDKPDLIWERPGMERLYLRLEDEFEISRALRRFGTQAGTHLADRGNGSGIAAKPPQPAGGMVHRHSHRAGNHADDLPDVLSPLINVAGGTRRMRLRMRHMRVTLRYSYASVHLQATSSPIWFISRAKASNPLIRNE